MERQFTSRREAITDAIVEILKEIDGTGDYQSNLYNQVYPTLKFWDEIQEYPAVHVSPGSEAREYLGAGHKDRYLAVQIRVYVQEEEAWRALSAILEDVETLLEERSKFSYTDRNGHTCWVQQITIVNITTDEGVLEPNGVGEIALEVRY